MTANNALPDTGGLPRRLAGWFAALLLLVMTACGGGLVSDRHLH
jgi:hypothetical protein